mmetsp:Transcript_5231/g.17148  ORF Transcript_5231/g.17148 Transcript_5231/m.17148 type:complete len:96 (-) Transcript_5231:1695-1982(-)
MVCGTLVGHTLESPVWTEPDPRGSSPMLPQRFSRHEVYPRAHYKACCDGGMVSYSPNFATDNVVFGASQYSIYVSFDGGVNFREIFELPYNTPVV